MFDFSFGELAIVVLVALLIVGPKDLPKVMHAVGKWFGQFKGISDEFRSGFKAAMREHQLEDLEKDLTSIHTEIHKEVGYIRDQKGNMQPIYEVADFLEERSKVTIIPSPPQEGQEKKSS